MDKSKVLWLKITFPPLQNVQIELKTYNSKQHGVTNEIQMTIMALTQMYSCTHTHTLTCTVNAHTCTHTYTHTHIHTHMHVHMTHTCNIWQLLVITPIHKVLIIK